MGVRHFISVEDFSIDFWNDLYALCKDIIIRPGDFLDACRGKVMASLFYEPSTRTNFSFQAAMERLGGSVFGFSDPGSTSAVKGESLADTIRMCAAYADVIVMRSPQEGAALAAGLYSEAPIINAGDGGHMHPTQTLADLVTINEKRGFIGDMNIGLCGDLKYNRTVHSLVSALSKFPKVNFYLISPRDLAMPPYMLSYMKENGQKYVEVTGLEVTIPQLDVLYMTRIQKERFVDPLEYERNRGIYILNRRKLERAKKDLLVMHPLPRVDEISPDVDADPRAIYFQQARYGMFIRMALLLTLCNEPRIPVPPPEGRPRSLCRNPKCVTQSESYLPNLEKTVGSVRSCAYCDKEI